MGFDDIKEAAFQTPSLTTIRQPLHQMGALAVQTLLQQLGPSNGREFPQIAVEPELIVRESTGPVRGQQDAQRKTASASLHPASWLRYRLDSSPPTHASGALRPYVRTRLSSLLQLAHKESPVLRPVTIACRE